MSTILVNRDNVLSREENELKFSAITTQNQFEAIECKLDIPKITCPFQKPNPYKN